MTREHVLPRWLHRALNITGEITLSTQDREIRRASALDVTVRGVCGPCNNGWMHDLENGFRTLMLGPLHGLPASLTTADQTIVATWGIKTWLLLETAFAHERGGRVISDGTLAWLREHNEPPGDYEVRLGHLNAERRQIMWTSTIPCFQRTDQPPIGAVGVFTIANLVFHIWAPIYSPDRPDAQMYSLGIGQRFAPFFLRVWPNEVEEVRWPPQGIFRIEDLDREWPPNKSFILQPVPL